MDHPPGKRAFMFDTICYLGFSAHDFTEISGARKRFAPSAELRFFTTATELLDHVGYSHATRTLVFLDTRTLDADWELVRRLAASATGGNVQMLLLGMKWNASDSELARRYGLAGCLESPVQAGVLERLLALPSGVGGRLDSPLGW